VNIVLVRHGETRLNAARVIQPADTPLGERGRAQARAVARRLAAARPAPAAILSSDLPRALETAAEIAAAAGGLELQVTALLRERNFGALRGQAFDSLDYDPLATAEAPPGGESADEFEARVVRAFEDMLARRARLDGDLVVVSHGLVIRTILSRHARYPAGVGAPERLANTSVSIVSARPPHEVVLAGCAAHLDAASSDDGRGLVGF